MKRISRRRFYLLIITTTLSLNMLLYHLHSAYKNNPLSNEIQSSRVGRDNAMSNRNRMNATQKENISSLHSDDNTTNNLEETISTKWQHNKTKEAKKIQVNNVKQKSFAFPTDDPILVQQFYRRDRLTEKVNEYKYDYILTPKQTCDNETYMVIFVLSFHTYNERRQAIRSTWGGAATGHHPWPQHVIKKKIKLFFLLGIHTQSALNRAIANESQQYSDIIQGNFFDTYSNLTLKSLLGLKYASEYCKDVKFLLKSDDDTIINIPYLMEILATKNMMRGIMGFNILHAKVARGGKWNVNKDVFPFLYYPQYVAGPAYIISNDIVAELYNISHYIPHINIEDAYITGVLSKIIGVRYIKQGFFSSTRSKPPSACDIIRNRRVTGTNVSPAILRDIWNAISKDIKCH